MAAAKKDLNFSFGKTPHAPTHKEYFLVYFSDSPLFEKV